MMQNNDGVMLASRDILNYINELKELKEERKLIEQREKAIKFEISKFMGENANLMNEEGLIIATYKTQTQYRFDSAALKESRPKLYALYSKPIEVRTFLIKE